jgi:Cof subfamily protein (haloacid dehalogenase superfamily)
LYEDEELWNVLNVHRKLTNQEPPSGESTKVSPKMDASSMHESIMKSFGEETMQNLLNLHESLNQVDEDEKSLEILQTLRQSLQSPQKEETTIPPSLHSMVQEAVGAAIGEPGGRSKATTGASAVHWDEDTLQKIAAIRAIASDVDGTLLTCAQTLHPRSRRAIRRAVRSSQTFFLATGKSRKGALDSLGVEMTLLLENVPGVFLQGLYCVNGDGEVVFEQKLTNAAVAAVEQLAKECQVSLVAYDGDQLYSPELTESVMELTERYGEPKVAPLTTSLASYKPGIHKILVMHKDVELLSRVVRPQLEALAKENNASVTQAVPTMLEWLPQGCSKAFGVAKLCEALGIDPSTELLAIGDAENDVGMLEMASIGVAVGNACPRAQEAADFLMEETNNHGGAGSAMELFGFGLDE